MLDERLSLVRDLYDPCDLAADIGTDHARLPGELLLSGICERMLLTDISESALNNAREHIRRLRLTDRVSFLRGDGLLPLKASRDPCQIISITGMGGRTIRDILLRGRDCLRGASLILSAHTDLPLIREAMNAIAYHPDREEPVFCAGRYYLIIRARPGLAHPLSEAEIRTGSACLFASGSPFLSGYLARRRDLLAEKERGLLAAVSPEREILHRIREDLETYDTYLTKR